MPPSPRITADINQAKYDALCASLRLSVPPPIRFITSGEQNGRVACRGSFEPTTGRIVVYLNLPSQEMEKLRFLASEVTYTLLHELRHAHQYEHWTTERLAKAELLRYELRETEKDANHFANTQDHLWRGLVLIRRTQHGSGFSKLTRHETVRNV